MSTGPTRQHPPSAHVCVRVCVSDVGDAQQSVLHPYWNVLNKFLHHQPICTIGPFLQEGDLDRVRGLGQS